MTRARRVRGGHDFVRPYIMTGGRTRAERRDLRIETMLQASVTDIRATFRPSRRSSCARARSRSRWPSWPPSCSSSLGVVAVIAGDLIATGLLDVHHTDPVEIELDMLTKMIERVRAI